MTSSAAAPTPSSVTATASTASTPPWQLWAPPLDPPTTGGLPADTAQQIADANPNANPYLVAALMWESYAAQLPVAPATTSVNTGAQSVTYAGGGDPFSLAIARANWLRSMLGTFESIWLIPGDLDEWPIDWWQRNLENPP